MSLEQEILDALNRAPATKSDLIWTLDATPGAVANAIRRLVRAKEIELVAEKKGMIGVYRARVRQTSLLDRDGQSLAPARIYDPATDPKPDWLRRGA